MNKRANWQRVSIKDICDSIIDCINKTAPVVDYPTKFKMIRTSNIKSGWIDLSDVKYVTKETFERWTRRAVPKKGDVILTREAPLGEVGMLRHEDNVFLGQRLVQYRANPRLLNNKFLLYAFQEADLQSQIRSFGSGATVEHMRVPDAEKLTVLLPSLPIQNEIANVLSAYDDLIEKNTRRIAILEEMARMIYHKWFIKFHFPGYKQVKMVDSALGPIPEGWEPSQFSEIAELSKQSIDPGRFKDETFVHYSMPAYDQGQMPMYELGANIKSTKFLVRKGALLLSKLNPRIPRVWLPLESNSSYVVSSTEFLVLLPQNFFSKEFIYCLCTSQDFNDKFGSLALGTSTSHQRVKPENLLNLSVVVPTSEAVTAFTQTITPAFDEIKNLRLKNANLARTRDLLLPRLISGEIDVSSWVKESDVAEMEQELVHASHAQQAVHRSEPDVGQVKPIDVKNLVRHSLWDE